MITRMTLLIASIICLALSMLLVVFVMAVIYISVAIPGSFDVSVGRCNHMIVADGSILVICKFPFEQHIGHP